MSSSSFCEHLNSFLKRETLKNAIPIVTDECSYCFASRSDGLDLCLECLCCYCTLKDRDHSNLHQQKTGHSFYLTLVESKTDNEEEDKGETESSNEPKKSATENDSLSVGLKCTICNSSFQCYDEYLWKLVEQPSDNSKALSSIWEYEIKECPHSIDINPLSNSLATIPSSCSECPLSDNIWMCLKCGHCGCGRSYFDGSGGNNHAIDHSKEDGHCVAVKIGTISREGDCDAYCYACNDSVRVSDLIKHLATLGIPGLASLEPTTKSTQQLEQEMNESFQPQSDTCSIDGTLRLHGPNQVGLSNMGNTCYMNSSLVCLLKVKPIKEFFNSIGLIHQMECNKKGPDCFYCQLVKLCNALTIGNDSIDQADLVPKMFRVCVGKRNENFKTTRQQDVHEFTEFLFTSLEQFPPLRSLIEDTFQLHFTSKFKCTNCCGTFLREESGTFLLLNIPHQTNKEESVKLSTLVDSFFAPSIISLQCTNCSNNQFIKQTWLTNTPRQLIVVLCRYSSIGGLLEKNSTSISSSTTIDLSPHIQGEVPLEGNEFLIEEQVDEESLLTLMSLGFDRSQCISALKATKGQSLDATTNWLFDNPIATTTTTTNTKSSVVSPLARQLTLSSFILHIGKTLSSGHYIAYHKDSEKDRWISFNDSLVTQSDNPPLTKGYIYFYQ